MKYITEKVYSTFRWRLKSEQADAGIERLRRRFADVS